MNPESVENKKSPSRRVHPVSKILEVIKPWLLAKSEHPQVNAVLGRLRSQGRAYLDTFDKSLAILQTGLFLCDDCLILTERFWDGMCHDEAVVDELRMAVQSFSSQALAVIEAFSGVKKNLLQLKTSLEERPLQDVQWNSTTEQETSTYDRKHDFIRRSASVFTINEYMNWLGQVIADIVVISDRYISESMTWWSKLQSISVHVDEKRYESQNISFWTNPRYLNLSIDLESEQTRAMIRATFGESAARTWKMADAENVFRSYICELAGIADIRTVDSGGWTDGDWGLILNNIRRKLLGGNQYPEYPRTFPTAANTSLPIFDDEGHDVWMPPARYDINLDFYPWRNLRAIRLTGAIEPWSDELERKLRTITGSQDANTSTCPLLPKEDGLKIVDLFETWFSVPDEQRGHNEVNGIVKQVQKQGEEFYDALSSSIVFAQLDSALDRNNVCLALASFYNSLERKKGDFKWMPQDVAYDIEKIRSSPRKAVVKFSKVMVGLTEVVDLIQNIAPSRRDRLQTFKSKIFRGQEVYDQKGDLRGRSSTVRTADDLVDWLRQAEDDMNLLRSHVAGFSNWWSEFERRFENFQYFPDRVMGLEERAVLHSLLSVRQEFKDYRGLVADLLAGRESGQAEPPMVHREDPEQIRLFSSVKPLQPSNPEA